MHGIEVDNYDLIVEYVLVQHLVLLVEFIMDFELTDLSLNWRFAWNKAANSTVDFLFLSFFANGFDPNLALLSLISFGLWSLKLVEELKSGRDLKIWLSKVMGLGF